MKTPTNLSHQPIIAVDDYKDFEPYPKTTDAMTLSIGFAQWSKDDPNEDKDISVKIFRRDQNNPNATWSRQSEEVPLYRILDMAILTISAFIGDTTEFPLKDLDIKVVDQNKVQYIEKCFEKFKKSKGNNSLLIQIKELEMIINQFKQKFNLP